MKPWVRRALTLALKALPILLPVLLVGLGGWLRLTAVNESRHTVHLGPDARHYVALAYNLKNAGAYSTSWALLDVRSAAGSDAESAATGEQVRLPPSAHRTPGYPLFLTAFFGADTDPEDPQDLQNILRAQALLSTLGLMLAYLLFYAMFGPWFAIVALGITAISPHLVNSDIFLLTESLFSFALVALCLAAVKSFSAKSWRWAAGVGALAAMGALIRPTLTYAPWLIIGMFWIARWPTRQFRVASAAMLISFTLVMSPWWVRNLIQFGQVSDPGLARISARDGLYPNLMFEESPESYGFPYQYDPRAQELLKTNGALMGEIARRFGEEPMRHLEWYLLGKARTLWQWSMIQGHKEIFAYPLDESPYYSEGFTDWTYMLSKSLHDLVCMLALLGSAIAWVPKRWHPLSEERLWIARLLSALLLYYTALHMIAAPYPRYGIPMRPILYGMAMLPLATFARWMRARR